MHAIKTVGVRRSPRSRSPTPAALYVHLQILVPLRDGAAGSRRVRRVRHPGTLTEIGGRQGRSPTRARSSVGEHPPYKRGVAGSKPAVPTIRNQARILSARSRGPGLIACVIGLAARDRAARSGTGMAGAARGRPCPATGGPSRRGGRPPGSADRLGSRLLPAQRAVTPWPATPWPATPPPGRHRLTKGRRCRRVLAGGASTGQR